MEKLLQDVRYALRMLRKTPGFTAVAVIALALGIGANTAIFSVAEAFLLKPLPFRDLNRLVMVLELRPHETTDTSGVAPATYLDWKSQSRSFEQLGASMWNQETMSGEGVPEKVQGFSVTANFFDLLGMKPEFGRSFVAGDDQPGQEHKAVLGYGLWARKFGSDPKVIGKTIRLNGEVYEIVGVMPREFSFPMSAELWTPLVARPGDPASRSQRSLLPMGRLAPGVTVEQAQEEMRRIAEQISLRFPETNRGWSVRVMPVRLYAVGDLTQQYTLLLLGAVGFVLLIVCANVANLQFARASGREREIAVRLALGAGRGAVVRLLLTESALLGVAGVAPGLWLASQALDLILKSMPADVAKFIGGWEQIRLDWGAVVFTLTIAIAAGVVAGLFPALKSSRPDLEEALKESARGSSGSRATHRLRDGLVVTQVALALILMAGAGLMVKGFRSLIAVHQHVAPEQVLTMRMILPNSDRYATPQQVAAFYERALEELSSIPGVQSAAVLTNLPFSNNYSSRTLEIEGRSTPDSGDKPAAIYEAVSSGFFRMMDIPLREGRLFDTRDSVDAPPAVIVSANLARRYWPGENAVGHRVRLLSAGGQDPWVTIVGVVDDVKYSWLQFVPEQAVYVPCAQAGRHFSSLALRVSGEPMSLADTVRRNMAAIDPDLPLYEVKSHAQVIHESTVGLAYVAVMMAVIGSLGLALSALGVYGVISFAVGERTREFGIRLAMGAAPAGILRLILGRGALLTLVGLLIGLPGAMGLARLLANLLYGVSAGDASTFVGVCLVLATVAALACYFPARRAARTDPMVALRYE